MTECNATFIELSVELILVLALVFILAGWLAVVTVLIGMFLVLAIRFTVDAY